ncbi:hypothetical protein [Thalassobellus suaedae]|uniref:Alpha-L-arabinofuranosidase C-terminal domain-containing protein n=1 Tax=Thalassobellus suaedae TaxID=3074124 RepID=A0ABY9XTQ5_9FLAO|nr:hypothetical protein RHP51_00245 [Flavobacteriaceae bacterium HL-DH14]
MVPVGGDQPKENAGGNTYPLDVIATMTEDKTAVVLAIVNPTLETETIIFDFGSTTFSEIGTQWTISGTSVEAKNVLNQEAEVKINESLIKSNNKLTIEPATINLIRYNIVKLK